MKGFGFIFRLLKRTKRAATSTAAEVSKPDYSLRPNPTVYRDQNGESETIFKRIKSSSSSVLGIAGVRGTGKSSLALKVLNSCNQDGYFTLLIHSPTSYEPREFLLSIFQRVCEAAITRLERLFGQENTIEARGRAELLRSRRALKVLGVGTLIIVFVPMIFTYYRYRQFQSKLAQELMQSKSESLKAEIDANIKAKNSLENFINHPENYRNLSKDFSGLATYQKKELDALISGLHASGEHDNTLNLREAFPLSEKGVNYFLTQSQPEDVNKLLDLIDDELRKLSYVGHLYETRSSFAANSGDYLLQTTLPLALGGMVFYVLLIIIVQSGRKVRQRIKIQQQYPRETGLYRSAKDILEHLKYQTTVTSSHDATITLWKVASKFMRTKQLETRPISFPGLTADCNSFINDVAKVFGGKSIICLDELDKIIEPSQLEELLKSIKGILGQNKSHFLLTVSEDALARFTTRRRSERDVLESSFDEIIFLNRIDFMVAQYIVRCMLVLEDEFSSTRFNKNVLLVWMFSGGIPREIKRNVAVATERFDLVNDDPHRLWNILFASLLDSLQSWALIVSAEQDIAYDFLSCLESTRRSLPIEQLSPQDSKNWFNDLIAVWSTHYQLPFLHPNEDKGEAKIPEGAQKLVFERGIFELTIGALALLIITADEGEHMGSRQTPKLLEVFMLLSYSPSFAGLKFHNLLGDIHVLEDLAECSVTRTLESI